MLPDIQPGNTKILYFFNCLLDGMHTKIKHICDFIYLTEGCVLAVEENSIYCWRDLNRLQKDVAFLEDDFS